MLALLGKKIGMTQVIQAGGRRIPVTVIEAGPCTVTDIRTPEKNGYKAAQIGFGDIKEKKVGKALKTAFAKKKQPLRRWLREVRLQADENYEIGQEIKVDVFKAGDMVDVQGTSIGKGFAGGVKKWGWAGGPESHGSMFHRRIGSAGASSFPSRSWPGLHMPGHMGDVTKTVQNLEVVKVQPEKNILVVKGAVPGGDNGLLYIRKSLKRPEGVAVHVEEAKAEKKDAGKKKTEKPKK